MANKIRIELNTAEIGKFLKSKEVEAIVKERADSAVASLGDGYMTSTYIGKTRANASVAAVSEEAKQANLKDNVVLKAVLRK